MINNVVTVDCKKLGFVRVDENHPIWTPPFIVADISHAKGNHQTQSIQIY